MTEDAIPRHGAFEELCRSAEKGGQVEIAVVVRKKRPFLVARGKTSGKRLEVPLDPLDPDGSALELSRRLLREAK